MKREGGSLVLGISSWYGNINIGRHRWSSSSLLYSKYNLLHFMHLCQVLLVSQCILSCLKFSISVRNSRISRISRNPRIFRIFRFFAFIKFPLCSPLQSLFPMQLKRLITIQHKNKKENSHNVCKINKLMLQYIKYIINQTGKRDIRVAPMSILCFSNIF